MPQELASAKSSNIPSLEKRIISFAFAVAAIQLGLIGYAALRLNITVPTCVTNVRPFTAGQFIKIAPKRYEVHVLAKMWQYQPNVIRVPRGSVVDFYLTSGDVTHGFYVDRTNVNLMALPGVVNYAQARFRNEGKYSVLCHEYCGVGHHMMNGVVEVTDENGEASAEGME